MKKLLLILGCLSTLGAFAQQDLPQNFSNLKKDMAVVTGYLKGAPNDTIVRLYEPYSGEHDSAFLKNGRFTIKMPVKKGGSMYILKVGQNPDPYKNGMIMYVEGGMLHVAGKGMALNDVKLSGDTHSKEWQEVWGMLDIKKGDSKKLFELEKQFRKASAIGDEDAADEINRQADSLMKIRNKWIRNWIATHPNSGVSAYLATCYIRSPKEKDSIMQKLGQHAKDSRIARRYFSPGKYDAPPMTLGLTPADTSAAALNSIAVGKPAPDFSVPDVDGKTIALADFKGKYVLLDFWASWCGPCKPQIPFLKAASEKFRDKNLVVVGVSLDSKKESWLKAIEKHGLNWINASNLKGWSEPVARAYGASAIPFNVLIGPDGTILAMGLYDDAIDKKLSELVK